MPNPIPADILIHVAQFIPEEDLRSMLNINSTFFQLAMDAKYHKVVFSCSGDQANVKRALRKLRRLRDPTIAFRVRSLYLYLSGVIVGYYDSNHPELMPHRVIQTLTNSVIRFTNVKLLHISWSLARQSFSVEQILHFINTAWNAFGSNVQQVNVTTTLQCFPTLMPSTDGPMKVRHLDVTFLDSRNPSPQKERLEHTELAVAAWTQFINRVAPTLRSLRFTSYMKNFEHSSLFCQLQPIPNLERLHIVADCDAYLLSDALGLPRFLRNHATTLRHFIWTGTWQVERLGLRDGHSKVQRMTDWLNGNELQTLFSNLLTLHLPVPESSAGIALVAQHIGHSADTLNSLKLWDYHATYENVRTLVSVFKPGGTGHLRELNLQVDVLSPKLVVLLARAFPHLEELSMRVSFVAVGEEERKRIFYSPEEELLFTRNFAEAMRKCDMHEWRLYNIGILAHGLDPLLRDKLMVVFAKCIPSVQKFFGRSEEDFFGGRTRAEVMSR